MKNTPIIFRKAETWGYSFQQKFKTFLEQYELREYHFHSMLKMKDCEVQLNVARLEEQRKRADQEAVKSRTLNTQVSTFSQTETELRTQLGIYVEKFKQVSLGIPSPGAGVSMGLVKIVLQLFGNLIYPIIHTSVVTGLNSPSMPLLALELPIFLRRKF